MQQHCHIVSAPLEQSHFCRAGRKDLEPRLWGTWCPAANRRQSKVILDRLSLAIAHIVRFAPAVALAATNTTNSYVTSDYVTSGDAPRKGKPPPVQLPPPVPDPRLPW